MIGSCQRIQGRSDTSITNNQQQLHFTWLTNKFRRNTTTENKLCRSFARDLPELCQKMQKLAGDKQNRLATSRTRWRHKNQAKKTAEKLNWAFTRDLPEKTENSDHSKNSGYRINRRPQSNFSTTQSRRQFFFFFFPMAAATLLATLHQLLQTKLANTPSSRTDDDIFFLFSSPQVVPPVTTKQNRTALQGHYSCRLSPHWQCYHQQEKNPKISLDSKQALIPCYSLYEWFKGRRVSCCIIQLVQLILT